MHYRVIRKLKIMLLIIVNMNIDLFIVEQKEHQTILQGGFAINVNGVAKVIEKNGVLPALPRTDVLVYAEEGCEVAALKAAQELREQGFVVENALFDDIESARAYAMDKKIAKVVVIDESDEEEQE